MGLSTGHPQPGCEAALTPVCIPPALPQPHKQPAESMVSQVDPRGFYLQSFSHLKHAQRVRTEHRHLCTGSSRTAGKRCRTSLGSAGYSGRAAADARRRRHERP